VALEMALRLCFAVFLLVGVTSHAAAQPRQPSAVAQPSPEARDAFERGRSAYERGRFGEAVTWYERAHELSPHPTLLFNIGRAADSDGSGERAIQAYSAYLEAVPGADNREFVEGRLERLRATLAATNGAPSSGASASEATSIAPAAVAVAAAAEPTPFSVGASGPVQRDESASARPVWKRGWFWATVGAVVVTGVVVGIVAARAGSDGTSADLSVRALREVP
jgi:tetratricopeptide (TPR) repeat protein